MNLRTFSPPPWRSVSSPPRRVAQTTYLPLGPGPARHDRRRPYGLLRHQLEDFKVEVLGVMRNVIGPKRNLILARPRRRSARQDGVIAA
jgi:hypothetical protein